MKTNNAMVDSGKRHTLKRLIGTAGATATLATLPAFSKPNLNNEKNTLHVSQASSQLGNDIGKQEVIIDVILVSIPGTSNETLLLKNLTNKPLTVDRFEQAIVTFDGETMDCGMVCEDVSIVIPANKDVMMHFSSLPIQHQSKHSINALDVQAVVSRLPEGTRVIPLTATMQGTTAILFQA